MLWSLNSIVVFDAYICRGGCVQLQPFGYDAQDNDDKDGALMNAEHWCGNRSSHHLRNEGRMLMLLMLRVVLVAVVSHSQSWDGILCMHWMPKNDILSAEAHFSSSKVEKENPIVMVPSTGFLSPLSAKLYYLPHKEAS